MKIQYLSLLAVCAIAASCTTENLEPTIGEKSGLHVSLEQPESETLTKGLNWTDNKLTFAWEEGELLSVFNTKGNAYTNFTSQESGTSAQFTCEGFDLTNGDSYITALPPSVINYRESAPQIPALAVSFLNQTQNGADNTEHLKNYLYAYSSASEVADNKLTIDLQNQVAWIILQYTNTDEAALEGIRSITMSIQDNLFVTEGTMDATGSSDPSISGTSYAKELTLSFKEPVNIAKDETLRAYFTICPVDLKGQNVTFTANLSDESKMEIGTYNGATMKRNMVGRYVSKTNIIKTDEQLKEALAAVTADSPVELTLAAGEFSTKGLSLAGKTVTIKGEGQDKTILNAGTTYPASNGADVVFENLTIIGTDGDYTGFQHSGNVTFRNVHFKGVLYTYSSGVDTFENCTFEPTVVGKSVYPVVCYGGLNTVFKNCEFKNGQGKGILVYNEGDGADRNYDITISDCTFTATGPNDKGAIEIHTELWPENTTGTITINNTKCDANFGGGLWREWYNKDTKHATDYFKVVVDGITEQEGTRQ